MKKLMECEVNSINKKKYVEPQLKCLGGFVKIVKGGSSSCSDGASGNQTHACR